MTKHFFLSMAVAILFVGGCKKDKDEALDSKVEQHNRDANTYKSELDQTDNDINDAIKDIPAFGKTGGTASSPLCGCTIDSSQIAQKILFFNFDGVTPCFSPSRTRSGQIKVQLTQGQYWSNVGSVLTLTFNNYKITRLSDNRSIQFNGTKTLQNINGNDWLGFLFGTKTLKYRERALNISVKFDDGSQATWNSARITEWSYVPAETKIVFYASGDTTYNGVGNTDSWGTNRYGNSFVTFYNSAIVSNTYCGLWRPVSGKITHRLDRDFIITFGVDQQGNATPYACAYGFKVNWEANNKTQEVILSY